jgi:antitoxin component of MazEF toxin-antitoxin module
VKRGPRKAPVSKKKKKRASAGTTTKSARSKLTTFAPPEHDPLSDSRLRPLVERYARLSRAKIDETGPHLIEMRVPEKDRAFFGGRDSLTVAFAVPALEDAPDAEMAIIGSPFVEQLLAAIRARGARLALGLVPPGSDADAEAVSLGVPVKNGVAAQPKVLVARHPVGRLLARVLIRAGATVEEHLVESSFFDLSSGTRLPQDVMEQCVAVEQGTVVAMEADADADQRASLAPARPVNDLLDLMVADLSARLGPRVDQLRAEAERALSEELGRIDRYYRAMLEDAGARETDALAVAAAGRAVEAEHARRRVEEERRHQVRALVHPLQMVEMEMVVQRAEWTLSTTKGERATLSARRYLGGPGGWSLSCPTCARVPSALIVCDDDQIACDSCAHQCSVCGEGFRPDERSSDCHVDGAPVCAEHVQSCSSCGQRHCSAHGVECAEGAHRVCTSCVAPCAACGRTVCASHAEWTVETAPGESRRLCTQCVVHCEGRRNEPVGRDEAVACASCERFVCERHQATCDVDGEVHCSSHLARTDHSRKLVCGAHRATCAHESETTFAADEVVGCPICGRKACSAHVRACAHCGRRVCIGEWEQATSRCATCRKLAPCGIPSEVERGAASDATDGDLPDRRSWRAARDSTHQVFELSHGWKRRTVFTLRHGESRAESVIVHSKKGMLRKR